MKTEDTKSNFTFKGFQSPNYTIVPDELFDDLLVELSGADLKVLLYIIRRTFGFKRDKDNISLSQMLYGIRTQDGRILDRGIGLTKKTLLSAIKGLEDRNVIITQRRRSQDKGNEPTTYSLNIVAAPVGVKITPPLGEKVYQGGGVKTTPRARGNFYPPQQTVLQETDKQQHVVVFEAGSKNVDAPTLQEITNEIADGLATFGISKLTAKRLADRYPEDYLVSKLEFAQFLVDKNSPLVAKNPAGYLRKSIEDDYNPPKGYKPKAQREAEVRQRSSQERREQEERHKLEEAARQERATLYNNLEERYPPTAIPGTGFTTRTAWEAVKALLKQSLPAFQSDMLEDAMLVLVDGGTAIVGTTNRFLCRYLANRLGSDLQEAFQMTLKQPLKTRFQVLTASS